jgi:hypothetical protein
LAFFTVEDKVSFAPFVASQAVAQFSYGKDILTLHTTSTSSRVARVTAIGEGAASAEGMDAWCWMVKDASSVTAEAGQGEPSMAISSPAWRTSDAARSAAEGFLALHTQGQTSGRLLVPGAPAVVVGSAVEIADAPGDGQNGLFLVRRVIHRFSKSAGFLTEIRFGGTGQGG